MSSPWAGSPSDPVVTGAFRLASRGMSSSWERRQSIVSSRTPPSVPFGLSRWKDCNNFLYMLLVYV
ncbi:hypothetical protein GW17_00000240 [Ensete ventricosum]|uniref:Uncharacterized protein n=1 Tax=Ensete ventricosum TaxID=4639 RepID=A0A444GJB6_ENSVE|nr:hypothetical protein B296_00031783 [Ensete ventricosum]RWW34957.1 hypothetical protein GW17_00000240 [Ensete ventricosum]